MQRGGGPQRGGSRLAFDEAREDEDDGSIRYVIFDERPESYRFVCAINDDAGANPAAKDDADLIARGLNLLVQYGLEQR